MISGMINSRSGALLAGGLAILVFVVLNLGVSSLTGVRLDLTQDKLYTLSDGTRNILKSLNRPATLTFYYSRRLGDAAPAFGVHAARVRDLIKEFAAASAGNLTVIEKDPEPFR